MSSTKGKVIWEVIETYKNESGLTIGADEVQAYIQSVRFLEDILSFSQTCFFVVEYNTFSYLYCSSNVSDILGRPTQDYLAGGPAFTLQHVSDPDLLIHQRMHKKIIDLCSKMREEERERIKFAFTIRLVLDDGSVKKILQNNFILKWSDDGKPLVKLFTLTDITPYKSNEDFVFYATRMNSNGESSIIFQENFSGQDDVSLTERELEILKLLSADQSARDIGRRFSISENTVKNHKTSIMKKLGAKNTTHTIRLASLYGLISDNALSSVPGEVPQ